jgi:hypothetical protein
MISCEHRPQVLAVREQDGTQAPFIVRPNHAWFRIETRSVESKQAASLSETALAQLPHKMSFGEMVALANQSRLSRTIFWIFPTVDQITVLKVNLNPYVTLN